METTIHTWDIIKEENGFEKIIDALTRNLEYVNLNNVEYKVESLNLNSMKLSLERVKQLADAIKVNRTITELYLYHNKIGNEGIKYISEALKVNRTITSLDLSRNYIGDEGIKAIFVALEKNTTITILDLSRNYIGDEGAKALAKVLKVNGTINELNLGDTDIGNEGAKCIAEALKVNKTITSLILYGNKICAEDIASILKNNNTLVELYIDYESIGRNGILTIENSLQHNNTILELGLITTGDNQYLSKIDTLLNRNKNIYAWKLLANCARYGEHAIANIDHSFLNLKACLRFKIIFCIPQLIGEYIKKCCNPNAKLNPAKNLSQENMNLVIAARRKNIEDNFNSFITQLHNLTEEQYQIARYMKQLNTILIKKVGYNNAHSICDAFKRNITTDNSSYWKSNAPTPPKLLNNATNLLQIANICLKVILYTTFIACALYFVPLLGFALIAMTPIAYFAAPKIYETVSNFRECINMTTKVEGHHVKKLEKEQDILITP